MILVLREEHEISDDGACKTQNNPLLGNMWLSQSDEKSDVTFKHRALIVDTEPRVCAFLQSSAQRKLYTDENIVSGLNDCAHNFARGFHHIGKDMMDDIKFSLRKIVEKC